MQHGKYFTSFTEAVALLVFFTNCTGKHLCWSLFLIKLHPWRLATLPKETRAQTFSFEKCEIFRKTYFKEHLRTTASSFTYFAIHLISLWVSSIIWRAILEKNNLFADKISSWFSIMLFLSTWSAFLCYIDFFLMTLDTFSCNINTFLSKPNYFLCNAKLFITIQNYFSCNTKCLFVSFVYLIHFYCHIATKI